MANTYIQLGESDSSSASGSDVNLHDSSGNSITSTIAGAKRGLDVNLASADSSAEVQVEISAADGDNISIADFATPSRKLVVNADGSINTTATGGSGLTDTQLRASPVPVSLTSTTVTGTVAVSAASLPLPSGASTSALQSTGNTSVASIDTKTPALGQAAMTASRPVVIASNQSSIPVAATQSGTWTVQPGNTANTTAWKVDGSAVTQPISASSLPLPTGAATASAQADINTNLVNINTVVAASDSRLSSIDGGVFISTTSLQLLDDVPAANNAAFSKGNTIMGQMDDTSTVVATENNVSAVRITAQRGLHTNLRNVSGTEIGTSSTPVRVDPTGTTAQPASQSGTWNVTNVSGTVSLPTGASTSAKQDTLNAVVYTDTGAIGTQVVAVAGIDRANGTAFAIPLDDGGNNVLVSVQGIVGTITVQGNVGHDSVDTGSPLKTAGYASTTAPTAVSAAGDRVNNWSDLNGRQSMFSSYSFSNVTTNTTTQIKTGAGVLHSIVINTKGVGTTATIYDNTATSGTKIATIDTTLSTTAFLYDAAFGTGLRIVTAGTTAADLTLTYL